MAKLLKKSLYLFCGLAVMQLSNATTFNLYCRYLVNDIKAQGIKEEAITYNEYFESNDAKSITLFDKLRDKEISAYEFSISDADKALKICADTFNDGNLTRTLVSFEPRVDDVSSLISNNSVSSMFYSLTSALKNVVKQPNKPGFPIVVKKGGQDYERLVEYVDDDALVPEETLPLAKIYEFLKNAKQDNPQDLIIQNPVKSIVDRWLQKAYRLVTDKNKAMGSSKFIEAVDQFAQKTLQVKPIETHKDQNLYEISNSNLQNIYLINFMNTSTITKGFSTEKDIVRWTSCLISNALNNVDLQSGKSYKFVTNLVVNSVFISHIVPVTMTIDSKNERIKVKVVDSMLTSFNQEKEAIARALVDELIKQRSKLQNYERIIEVIYSKLQVAGTVDCARFTTIGMMAELLNIDYENMPPLLVYQLLDMYSLDSRKEKGEVLYGAKTVLIVPSK